MSQRTLRISEMPARPNGAWLAGALALLVVLAPASPTQAATWYPQECKDGVTGDEFGDPPVVEYYVNSKVQTGSVKDAVFNSKGGTAWVYEIKDSSDLYLISVTYTPFLIGTVAVNVNFSGGRWIRENLPPAGYSVNSQSKIFDVMNVTITDPKTSQPMPGASVMWAPYFTGADPYVTTTDSNGKIVINCFQSLPAGYSVYVVSADGKTEFTAVVSLTNLDSTAAGSSNSSPNVGFSSNH